METFNPLIQDVAAALQLAGLDAVSLGDLERGAIANALQKFHGNRTVAARTLGISVRTLQRKLKAWSWNSQMATVG
jgi:DNA-binding NtrC family response regulator